MIGIVFVLGWTIAPFALWFGWIWLANTLEERRQRRPDVFGPWGRRR